jgi:hypothetical protein
MLILTLIIFFILFIFSQIFLAYFQKKTVEGMMDVIPTISPSFVPTNKPVSSPTNEMLPNLTFTQVYKQYDKQISHNTFMLAQQNAGNIEYLKQRIEDVMGLKNQIQDLSGNVSVLQSQLNGLVSTQQQYATQLAGGSSTPPTITGADSPSASDTSDLVTS